MSAAPDSTPDGSPALTRAQWMTLAAAFLGWMFDGLEMGIFPLVARPALQDMLRGAGDGAVGVWMGWITALFLLGAAGGGVLFGWLGDRIGRVRAMALSILVYSGFSGLCYFAQEPWHLAGLRFLSALGMGGEWSLGVALVMETWPARHRVILAGALGAAANCGFLLIAVIGYLVPITSGSWRWVMVVGALPAVLTFLIRLFVPESESWKQSVARAPGVNPLREIFAPANRRNTLLGISLASVVLIGTWGSIQWLPLWADKLAGGAPQAKALTSMLSAAGAVVGCFAGSLLGHFGRRPAFCLLALASFVGSALLFRSVQTYGPGFLTMVFVVSTAAASFYGWLPLYLPEIFPTRIRATAQGVSYNSGRILAAGGALGAGQLVAYYGGDYARMGATITFIYLAGAALIWLAPETKGRPLPE